MVTALTPPPMGEIYMQGNSTATTIGTAGSYVKALGTSTLTPESHHFDMPSNNRLRYTGTKTKMFHVAFTISYKISSGNNQEVRMKIYKNGSDITASLIKDTMRNSSDVNSSAIHVMVSMAQNDYLELYLTNQTSTNGIIVDTMNLFAMGVSQGSD